MGRARRSLTRRAAPEVAYVVTVSEAQARHLEECLSSVRAQDGVRAALVLAPWGTWHQSVPPGSVAVSRTLAEARASGLTAAQGAFLRFLEATDTLPGGSTSVLLSAIRASPVASAAGVSERIDATWRDRAHAVPPAAALDLGARLFRLTDDTRAGLRFEADSGRWADGTLARFDGAGGPVTVAAVVHHDHHREHGLPFGHEPRRAADVHALAAAVGSAAGAVPLGLAPRWAAGVLDRRLPVLVEDVESFDLATWETLRATVALLQDLADPADLRVEARVHALLVADGRREDLTALVLRRWRDADDLPTRVREDGRVLADLGVDVPDDVLILDSRETPLWASLRRSRAEDGDWVADLVVVVRGVPSTADDGLDVVLRAPDGARHVLPATQVEDGRADRVAAESHTDHSAAGWRLRLEPGSVPEGAYDVELELRAGPVLRRGPVTHRDVHGSAGHLELTSVDAALTPVWSDNRLHLQIGAHSQAPAASVARVTGVRVDGLGLTVDLVGVEERELVLKGPATLSAPALRGAATFELEVDPWQLGHRPAPLGRYDLRLDGRGLALSPDLLRQTPLDLDGALHRLSVRATSGGEAFLVLEDLRDADEVGPGAQRRLQERYAVTETAVDPGLAYFQSYAGQHPTDSPLAIHESLRRLRPDLRVRWGVDDPGTPVPEGAEPVLLRSREWYDVLARARWIVTNIELDRWFRRRPGQELLQTWHGNPGKVMGLSLWRANGLTPGRIEQHLDHGPRCWSMLVSPTPEMTELYRREFAYDGPVVERGYPRDDALVSPDAARVRAETRRRLGIAEGQTAVLYAPTWRDTLATNFRAARLHDDLDVAAVADALGADHVVLLRGHRFHARHPERPGGARVVDVTGHPEVNHLILAADAAVLDYSSLRFDVGVAGIPMLFLVPDLDTYERTRGFLFDFRTSAPGPLLATTDDVVDALRDLDRVRREHATAYAAFRQRFAAGQDGHAADRAVQAFFGPA